MADVIYSASLASIGRTTHLPGTAAAHMKYIMRDGAYEHIVPRGIPDNAIAAAAWIDEQERGDRINARVCDKLMLALPHQLSLKQRITLVKQYCDEMSRGVPYVAALHLPSCDGDQRNYHCHIVFRDRDPITGKRVMKTSEHGSVERVRERWEHHVNAAMTNAGFDDRTDRRSHAERAIDRIPSIHVGAAATNSVRRASRDGKTPAGNVSNAQPLHSRARRVRNSVGAHSLARVVKYPLVDGDFTRYEENEYRAAINARLSRLEAQAAQAARLAAARASMSALGLGMVPDALHQGLRTIGHSVFVPSRTTAAARAAMAQPMPLTRSAWSEAEAFDRAQQRITAARSRRPLPVDAKASLAGQLRDEAIAAALEHHAGEVADNRIAAARLRRPLPVDAKAGLAGQLRDEAIAAALEHHAGEVADNRIAAARLRRPLPVDAKAPLARQLRDEAVAAALEHHAGEVASNRLAAARSRHPLPVDAKAALAGQLHAEAVAAALEHHAGEVADNRLAAARLPPWHPVDAKAALARQLRDEAAAAALEPMRPLPGPVPHHAPPMQPPPATNISESAVIAWRLPDDDAIDPAVASLFLEHPDAERLAATFQRAKIDMEEARQHEIDRIAQRRLGQVQWERLRAALATWMNGGSAGLFAITAWAKRTPVLSDAELKRMKMLDRGTNRPPEPDVARGKGGRGGKGGRDI